MAKEKDKNTKSKVEMSGSEHHEKFMEKFRAAKMEGLSDAEAMVAAGEVPADDEETPEADSEDTPEDE